METKAELQRKLKKKDKLLQLYKKRYELLETSTNPVITIPKKIVILGIPYKVRVQKKVVSNGRECKGMCSYKNKTIYIAENGGTLLTTLNHEICHVINYRLKLSQDDELFANTLGLVWSLVIQQLITKPKSKVIFSDKEKKILKKAREDIRKQIDSRVRKGL